MILEILMSNFIKKYGLGYGIVKTDGIIRKVDINVKINVRTRGKKMKKYIGTFVIPVENVYRFEIEADSEEKAIELLK